MKLDALDHPKTLDFCARLNVSLPTTVGHLEFFWAFTAKKSPQGNIGKWPNGAIARSCHWDGDPDIFVNALVDARYVDASKSHRLLVHDWKDHAPRWVLSKLSRAKLEIFDSSVECTREYSPSNSANSTLDSVRQAKPSHGRGREDKPSCASGDARLPESFLKFWDTYPKKKSKGDAIKAWKKLKPNEPLAEKILRAVQQARTSDDWLKDGGQFIPHPATWLNARGWEDEFTHQRKTVSMVEGAL